MTLENLEMAYQNGYDDAKAEFEPHKGNWINIGSGFFVDSIVTQLKCDQCEFVITSDNKGSNFCPNCGADMRQTIIKNE